MTAPTRPKWNSEAEMFASYVAIHRDLGFAIYPECCGYDLVMVAPDPLPELPGKWGTTKDWGALRPGDQIAIEGKLQGNLKLMWQSVPPLRQHEINQRVRKSAPTPASAHWYVALAPKFSEEFLRISVLLGVVAVMHGPEDATVGRRTYRTGWYPAHQRIDTDKPLDLPSVCVDIIPGQAAPRSVTPWKLSAVRLCLLGSDGRVLTREQVGTLERNFIENKWLQKTGRGRSATYRLLEHDKRPDIVYPEIVAALQPDEVTP
jgi:hypothetical protein